MSTITTTDLLTYNHIYSWAESLPSDWTARPGSCSDCPIAQYLNDMAAAAQKWEVGTYTALPGVDSGYTDKIDMPRWIAFFIECVDVHNTPISKARVLELLERCKPEEDAQ